MNRAALKLFQLEVAQQCRFASTATEYLDRELNALNQLPIGGYAGEHITFSDGANQPYLPASETLNEDDRRRYDTIQRAFYHLQALLVAAANISKLLWPVDQSNRAQSRGRVLRQSLGVDATSPIHERALRNHFEHFDEHIDKYADKGGSFADLIMDSVAKLRADSPGIVIWRGYDQQREEVVFENDSLALRPLVHAIEELEIEALKQLSTP